MAVRHGAAPASAGPSPEVPWWRTPWFPPLATSAAALGFYLGVVSYPWQLAVLAATAIGALVYSTRVTIERMRRLYTLPDETLPDEGGSAAEEDRSRP